MNEEFKSVIEWLIDNAKDNEWQIHHAAEDQYCPYCCKDSWSFQHTHNEGCKYVEMMQKCDELLKQMAV